MKLRSDWAKAYEPYARALRRLKLPKRGLPGSLRNVERVEAIARMLRAVKLRLRAKGGKR